MIPTGSGPTGPRAPIGAGHPPPSPGEANLTGSEATRRHWWSLAPVPTFSQTISARRAYLEALGVYLAFFGPSIVVAAGTLASFNPPNPEGWWITFPNGFEEITLAVLAVVVVLLLAERRDRRPRDVGLVLRQAKGGPGSHQAIRMAAWAALAFLVGSIVTSAIATGNFPFGHVNAANTVLDLTSAANAGVMEEVVVLGFLVTTLEQAGRSRGEIAVVALVCRGAYHIYYGPGALGILIWAGVFLWLFWRFRSVVPMIIAHICWDTLVFLIQVSDVFSAVLILALLALEITAVVLWLIDRSNRQAQQRPAWPRAPWGAPYGPWTGADGNGWPSGPAGPWVAPGAPGWIAPPETPAPGWSAPGWGPPAPSDGTGER